VGRYVGRQGIAVKKRRVLPPRAMSRRDFLKLSGAGVAGAALFGATGCGAVGASGVYGANGGGVRKFVYVYEQPDVTSQGIAANIFQKKLEEVSDGSMSITQYPSAALGGEPELLQMVLSQSVDFVNSSTSNATLLAPQSAVFSLHYLFESQQHAIRAVADQRVNDIYNEMTRSTVPGGHTLTLYASPLRNFYSKNIEVKNIDDLNGEKVRVQAARTEDITYAAYGAQTVHMAFGEVFTSLQTGVIDMAENALMYYYTAGQYEVAPVMSMTEHSGNTQTIWVTNNTWNGLSEEEKGWVQAAANEVGKTTTGQKGLDFEEKVKKDLKAQGVTFVEDVDKGSFKEIAEPLQDKLAANLGEAATQIVQRVRELQ
jgi:tripartite ATP-independent transporter DctP family solute receptor